MSSSTIGGAKVGSGLVVNNGVLSLKTPGACSYVGISESGELIQSNTPPSGGEVASTISTPVGTIIPWIGQINTPPDGYLLCDGREVSKIDYSELFEVIGTKFGTASEEGNFKLPNLTDERYLQGYSTAGEYVSEGLPNITGSFDIAEYYGSDNKVTPKSMTVIYLICYKTFDSRKT